MSSVRFAATFAVAAGLVTGATLFALGQSGAPSRPAPATELRPASSFAGIANPQQRSVALFEEAGKVLQHPRCMNCHPATDRPSQTDQMRPHQPLVVRG